MSKTCVFHLSVLIKLIINKTGRGQDTKFEKKERENSLVAIIIIIVDDVSRMFDTFCFPQEILYIDRLIIIQ